MRNTRKFFVLVTVCMLVLGACRMATAAESEKEKPKKTHWEITGQLEEACSCNAACPCWFNSLPTRMTCSGTQALFIKKGRYGKVKLDGLAVANMVQSPEGQTMMDSFGKWNFSYLYIDERANAEQRQALEDISKAVLPFAGSPKTEIRYAAIARKLEGKEHKITVGSYGNFSGHLIEGGLGGTPKIIDPPGADPIHHAYEQGRTTKLAYSDAGQNWNFENSNYMYGTFTVDSEQYEKYATGLGQKMAKMKQEQK